MARVRLSINGLTYSQSQTGAYALILSQQDSDKKLPIIIGGFEAQSIAIALEKDLVPPRPLTHTLFCNMMSSFDIKVVEVEIYKMLDSVFYSNIVCEREGERVVLDARTSDAVALAVHNDVPLYADEEVMEKASITLEDEEAADEASLDESLATVNSEKDSDDLIEEIITSDEQDFADFQMEELEKMLQEAVEEEDYELAVKVRDEIDRRNQ